MVDDIQKRKKKLRKLINIINHKKNKMESIQSELDRGNAVLSQLSGAALQNQYISTERIQGARP